MADGRRDALSGGVGGGHPGAGGWAAPPALLCVGLRGATRPGPGAGPIACPPGASGRSRPLGRA
eukprot:3488190-Pyramimonas_sp.AAC.1